MGDGYIRKKGLVEKSELHRGTKTKKKDRKNMEK